MGTVDCHFHVIAPADAAPMVPRRSYTPAPASLDEWRATTLPLGVTHGVVVQPSFYGTDNRVLLGALEQARGTLVGVAAVDDGVSDAELDRLARAGVRGVRMAHFEAGDPRAMGGFVPLAAFDALEDRLAERGMHLDLFTDSRLLPAIADRLQRSRVPVVIDHMGREHGGRPRGHPRVGAAAERRAGVGKAFGRCQRVGHRAWVPRCPPDPRAAGGRCTASTRLGLGLAPHQARRRAAANRGAVATVPGMDAALAARPHCFGERDPALSHVERVLHAQ